MNYNYLHTNITSSHPEIFAKKVFLKISKKSQKNTLPESLFNKFAGLSLATLLKKRLWHRCFPMDFAK